MKFLQALCLYAALGVSAGPCDNDPCASKQECKEVAGTFKCTCLNGNGSNLGGPANCSGAGGADNTCAGIRDVMDCWSADAPAVSDGPCWYQEDFYDLDGNMVWDKGCMSAEPSEANGWRGSSPCEHYQVKDKDCETGALAELCEEVVSGLPGGGTTTRCVSKERINELPCSAYSPLDDPSPKKQNRCHVREKCMIQNQYSGFDLLGSAVRSACIEGKKDCENPAEFANMMLCFTRGRRIVCDDPNDKSTCKDKEWCRACGGLGFSGGCYSVETFDQKCNINPGGPACPAGEVKYSYNPDSCSRADGTMVQVSSGGSCSAMEGYWSHCRDSDGTRQRCDKDAGKWAEVRDCDSCEGHAHNAQWEQAADGKNCYQRCTCRDGLTTCQDAYCLPEDQCKVQGLFSDCEISQGFAWRRECMANFKWSDPKPLAVTTNNYNECCKADDMKDAIDGECEVCTLYEGSSSVGEYRGTTESCEYCANGNDPLECDDLCAEQQCDNIDGATCMLNKCGSECDTDWYYSDGSLVESLTCINSVKDCTASQGTCKRQTELTDAERDNVIGKCGRLDSCVGVSYAGCAYDGADMPHGTTKKMNAENGNADNYCQNCTCDDGEWSDCNGPACFSCEASSVDGKGDFEWIPAGEYSKCNDMGWSRLCSEVGALLTTMECDAPCPEGQVRKTGYDPTCVDWCIEDGECGDGYCLGDAENANGDFVGWCVEDDDKCSSYDLDSDNYGPCIGGQKFYCTPDGQGDQQWTWNHDTMETCSTCEEGMWTDCNADGQRAHCMKAVDPTHWDWLPAEDRDECNCHEAIGVSVGDLGELPSEARFSDCGGPAGTGLDTQRRECESTGDSGGSMWTDWFDRDDCPEGDADECAGLSRKKCEKPCAWMGSKTEGFCKTPECADLGKKTSCEKDTGCMWIKDPRPGNTEEKTNKKGEVIPATTCDPLKHNCSETAGEEICTDRLGSICDLYQDKENWVVDRDACNKNVSCKAEGTKKKWVCKGWYQSPLYISTTVPMCSSKHILSEEDCCAAAAETGRPCVDDAPATVDDFNSQPPGCYYAGGTVYYNGPPDGSGFNDWAGEGGCDTLGDEPQGCICEAASVKVSDYKSSLKKMEKKLKKAAKKTPKKNAKKWGKTCKNIIKGGWCKLKDGNGNGIKDVIGKGDFYKVGAGMPQNQEHWDTYCDCAGSGKCEGLYGDWVKAYEKHVKIMQDVEDQQMAIREMEEMIDFLSDNPFGGPVDRR